MAYILENRFFNTCDYYRETREGVRPAAYFSTPVNTEINRIVSRKVERKQALLSITPTDRRV